MKDNFFQFNKTKDTLSQIAADMAILSSVVTKKADSLKQERQNNQQAAAEADKKMSALKNDTQEAINKIDSIIDYINGVL
jgi:hypothetical protein